MNQYYKLSVNQENRREIIGIQYFRGIASVMVVLCHTAEMANFPKYFNVNFLPLWLLSGSSGVHLFFVISGFIISHVSLSNQIKPKISPTDFLKRRFVRIIPFMWVCIIVYIILRFVGRGTFTLIPYVRAMVLYPIGDIMPNQLWTLRHEFLFYLLFCLFILSVKPRWEALAVWFLSPIIWLWLGASELVSGSSLRQFCDFFFHKANLLFGFGFFIGVLYNINFLSSRVKVQNGFIICLVLVIPLFVISYQKVLGDNFILLTGLYSSLILVLSVLVYSSSPLSYIDKFGMLLGDASYSIYLVHPAIISAVLGLWSKFQPNATPIFVLLVNCLLSCFIGIVVHKFIEKPIIRLARDKFERQKVTAVKNMKYAK